MFERAVERQRGLQLRALQVEVEALAATIAVALGDQAAELAVAGAQAAGGQLQPAALGAVETGGEVEVLQAVGGQRQALPLQVELSLRRGERTGQRQAAVQLALQAWPQLAEARQGQLQLAAQALVEGAAAVDAVVAEAHVQLRQLPLGVGTAALQLQQRRLAAQAALEVEVGAGLQRVVLPAALAAQGAGQRAGQLLQPVGRVECVEGEVGVPGQAVGEAQAELAFRPALAGLELQRRQMHLLQVAADRALQVEGAGRAVEVGVEMAEVVAVAVLHFGLQAAQRHRRFLVQRVEALPGEVAPGEAAVHGKAVLPVQAPLQLDLAILAGIQAQRGDIRAPGIDRALQLQRHNAALARQAGAAVDPVAVREVAGGVQQDLVETQGIRQLGAGLEAVRLEARAGRQVFGQRLHLAGQTADQVAAAVRRQLQGLLQRAFYL
ncbi:hypothetical protein D9M69_334710 [compost metagenome]